MSDTYLSNYSKSNIAETMGKFGNLYYDIIPPCKEVCGECENFNICNHCIVQGIIHCKKKCVWWKKNERIFEEIESKIG